MDGGNDPRRPSHRLTFDDAILVWQLRREGWTCSRIAARFDTNQDRVSEVLTEKRHPGSREEAESRLTH